MNELNPTASEQGQVHFERHGPVGVVTLDRQARRNALSPDFRDRLADVLESTMANADCRVVVIAGAGQHFCAGGDITSFAGMQAPSGRTRMQRAHRMVRHVMRGEKPVIAAVEGHAAGAGLCLAAACDLVVASETARFSCSFNRIGLFPDLAGMWSLPQRMGLGRARLLLLTGRMLDAAQAEAQGLVEQLCPAGEALATAIALGHEIARTAPLTNGLVKSVLARGPMPLEDLLSAEVDAQGVLYGSEDFDEGRRAFLEKRPPEFRGR